MIVVAVPMRKEACLNKMSNSIRRPNRRSHSGLDRTIFAVDLEKLTERMDVAKGQLRDVMWLFEVSQDAVIAR
jgi:hypothetical protein